MHYSDKQETNETVNEGNLTVVENAGGTHARNVNEEIAIDGRGMSDAVRTQTSAGKGGVAPQLQAYVRVETPQGFETPEDQIFRFIGDNRELTCLLHEVQANMRASCHAPVRLIELVLQRSSIRRGIKYVELPTLPSSQLELHWAQLITQFGPRTTYKDTERVYPQIVDSFFYELAQGATTMLSPLSRAYDRLSGSLALLSLDPYASDKATLLEQIQGFAQAGTLRTEGDGVYLARARCISAFLHLSSDLDHFHQATANVRTELDIDVALAEQECPNWQLLSEERRQGVIRRLARAAWNDEDECMSNSYDYQQQWRKLGALMMLDRIYMLQDTIKYTCSLRGRVRSIIEQAVPHWQSKERLDDRGGA
ncbi:hypothetical protein KC331_g96 [Hortaea werneckii]|nr:hypothetical protein KC331_g96 [Hortaea werneckii]